MRKSVRELLQALEAQGFTTRRTTKGHWMVHKDGRYVGTLAGTPSDHRSEKNFLAAARRSGFIHKGR